MSLKALSIFLKTKHHENDKLIVIVKEITEYISNLYNHVFIKSTKDGKINFVTSNIKSVLGYQENELLNKNLQDLVHENDCKTVA